MELQVASADHFARSAGLAALLGNCRALLAFARGAGWPVVHIHRRGQGFGRLTGDRPLPGLEPLPSEAVFFREVELCARHHPLATAPWPAGRSETLVVGFVNDQRSAEAFALSPDGAAPVADALAGGCSKQVIDLARRIARVDRLIAPETAVVLPPGWPSPANAP